MVLWWHLTVYVEMSYVERFRPQNVNLDELKHRKIDSCVWSEKCRRILLKKDSYKDVKMECFEISSLFK